MVWEIAGAAGLQAAAGLYNMYQNAKARKASARELAEIRRQFDAIKPPEYNLDLEMPPKAFESALKTPTFRGDYTPEIAKYIEEAAPGTIGETRDMGAGRSAQLAALQKYRDIAASESDPQLQAMLQAASRKAQTDAQSRSQAIQQDFERRGMGGAGVNLVAQMQAAADAMENESVRGQNAAAEGYRNRLEALRQGAGLGGQIRGEDIGLQGRNVDIINAYNARTAGRRQDVENQRAGALNQAGQFNIGRSDELAKWTYGTEAERERRAEASRQQEWQNKMAREAQKAGLQSKGFQDTLARQGAVAGVGQQQIQNRLGGRADEAAGIQGIAGAGAAGLGTLQQQDWEENMYSKYPGYRGRR